MNNDEIMFVGDDDEKTMTTLEVAFDFAQRALYEAPNEEDCTKDENEIYAALANFIQAMKNAGYEY